MILPLTPALAVKIDKATARSNRTRKSMAMRFVMVGAAIAGIAAIRAMMQRRSG